MILKNKLPRPKGSRHSRSSGSTSLFTALPRRSLNKILICLKCKLPFNFNKDIVCPKCNRKIKRKSKIIDLLGEKGYYWGEISQQEAKVFLKDAKKLGHKKASLQLGTKYPGMYEYIQSYIRGDWFYDWVDFSKTKRCLDIGSGWGAISFYLAHQFDEVWSLESVIERLQFQKIRADQEKIKNINFVRSDWLKLPFADNSFDLVSLNGVLEWIGLSDYSKNPQELQTSFLKEVKRVLKPGGCVYIGIENRFAFFSFLGTPDHSGIPFTSLLPRKTADAVVRKYRKTGECYSEEKRMSDEWPDYRTYTYSHQGYKKLLESADFRNPEVNWTISYNSPAVTGNFSGESFKYLLSFYKQHDFYSNNVKKTIVGLGASIPILLIKYIFPIFCPNFLIFAYKNTKSKGTFKNKIIRLVSGSTDCLRKSGAHGSTSKVNFFLLKNGNPLAVVRTARFKKFSKFLDKEEKLLGKWNNIKIIKKKIDNKNVYIEEYIDGNVCQTLSRKDNLAAFEWLIKFQNETFKRYWKSASFQKRIVKLKGTLKTTNIKALDKKKFIKLVDKFIVQSEQIKIPAVSGHGDFAKTNVIISNYKTYVIDWEFFEEISDPFFDFIFFLNGNSMVGKMPGCFEDNWIGKGKYSKEIKLLMNQFCQEYDMSSELLVDSISYVLLKTLSRRLDFKDTRHLDIGLIVTLINIWVKIYPQALKWLTDENNLPKTS